MINWTTDSKRITTCSSVRNLIHFAYFTSRNLTVAWGTLFLCTLTISSFFSKSLDQHIKHFQIVFKRLIEYHLTVNLNKSEFNKPEIEFLGYTVNSNGVLPSKSRIQRIENYPLPIKVKHVKKFLGMMNYYNRFVPNLAKMQLPLSITT